jgi:deoxyribodipyrimidine photo-lyase
MAPTAGEGVHVVWFKRDLRVHDHAPLALAAEAAAAAGAALVPLFVVEPGFWAEPDASRGHYRFLHGCLVGPAGGPRAHEVAPSEGGLDGALRQRGSRLVARVGDAVAVLASLHERFGIAGLWSHQETGNAWTYTRDKAVARWARAHGVPWKELPGAGVHRPHRGRDGWAGRWDARMQRPPRPAPAALPPPPPTCPSDPLPAPDAIATAGDDPPQAWRGDRPTALATLHGFLHARGLPYRTAMSSPGPAALACSRVAPWLTWGVLSSREVHQAAAARQARVADALAAGLPVDPRWADALASFQSRLRWRDHFLQKLEDEPALEHTNLHAATVGLRQEDEAAWTDTDRARFAAWRDGRTGYPLVDACMRSLAATGWLTFRMRAMLVSFASYDLWLHWRPTGLVLARRFTDYEPGIHWSQHQMQSGTTGINSLRVYNPTRQAVELDPDGTFIRAWVPELARVPTAFVHTPWKMPPLVAAAARCEIGRDYPEPLVSHGRAAHVARVRLEAAREAPSARAQAADVLARHGSRKRRRH